MQMQYAKYSKQTNIKQIPVKPCKMHNQTNKPPNHHPFSTHHHLHNKNNNDNNNNTILRTLGCVGSRCRWFINRPPPTHHTNLDAIYRWQTTRTRMSKRSCWARKAYAPVSSRAKIWSLGKYFKINELVDHSAIKQPNRTTNQIQQWKTKLSICSYQTKNALQNDKRVLK